MGLLVTALWTVLGFILTVVVIKFVAFQAIYLASNEMADFAANYVLKQAGFIDPQGLITLIKLLPPAAFYFADIFYLFEGARPLLAALTTTWMMKRIPFVG